MRLPGWPDVSVTVREYVGSRPVVGLAVAVARVNELLDSFLAKLIIWGILSALLYHLVAGIKHLFMDMGIGEELESGRLASKITIVVSVILIVLAGVWVW